MDKYTTPEFRRIALITIDVQRDFLDDGASAVAGTTAVLPQIVRLLETFRLARLPIVHVVRVYKADGSNVDLCRREMVESGKGIARPGTPGMQLARALSPEGSPPLDAALLLAGSLQPLAEREWAMYKPRWGAFYGTRLQEHLEGLGITTLAFCGCNFPNCPRTSMYEASERDFRVVLVTDAVSGLYDRGSAEMANIGVSLMSSMELSSAMARIA